jgi:hypothetical protein
MRAADLFSVLAEVATEHEGVRPDHPPLVIPVLLGTLENPRDLLEQAAEVLGGTLLDLTSGGYDEPIAAYSNSELRGEVQVALSSERPRSRTDLELSYTDGVIDAVLRRNGDVVSVPTPADVQLMTLARALFDQRLERCELAMLLLSENSFDTLNQERVLRMLTALGERQGLRLGAARTLVVFIQSDALSISRHCQPKHGVRFSLTGSRLVRRNRYERMPETVRKLVAQRPRPLVLFLAAGFAVSSGMPVGNRLRDVAIKRICELPADDERHDEELGAVLYDYATGAGRTLLTEREKGLSRAEFARTVTLEQVARIEAEVNELKVPPVIDDFKKLHDEQLASGRPLGQAVYELDRVIEKGGRLVLITVNFDELIEHEHGGRLDIAITDPEFERLTPVLEHMREGGEHPEGKIPLLKLHGTVSRPETCIVTDEQTRSGVSEAKQNALLALAHGLEPDSALPWVYVGASMRDIDLTNLFSLRPFVQGVNERWVAPYLEESVERFVANTQRFWSGRETLQQRTVTETADAFMAELARQWCS